MGLPLVSCLTATHGRYSVLREAVSCFLGQDYPNKELVILNNHDIHLTIHLPQVRLYNRPGFPTLGHCRNWLLRKAKGEFVRTWDDDDLYLPWAISQGVSNIGSHDCFKPLYSWDSRKNSTYALSQNVYEASVTVRREFALQHGYKESGGDEHEPLNTAMSRDSHTRLLLVRPSYVYRWDTHLDRISGTLGSDSVENRTSRWMKNNDDHGDGDSLEPVDMTLYWRTIEQEEKNVLDNRTDLRW